MDWEQDGGRLIAAELLFTLAGHQSARWTTLCAFPKVPVLDMH
jgi:hypothetical protein